MEKKYLYGKLEHFALFLDGAEHLPMDRGLRFCDIIHYKTMENEKVRDNESERVFTLDKELFTFKVDGKIIDSKDMVGHPSITIEVPRCYCLCLSAKKNDPELFSRFNADVCIEVNVEGLVEFLEKVVAKRLPLRVIHRPVTYYPTVMTESPPIEDSLVFYKEAHFAVEAEYRVALMFPERISFVCDGEKVEVLKGEEPSFMQIGHKDKILWGELFTGYALRSDRI